MIMFDYGTVISSMTRSLLGGSFRVGGEHAAVQRAQLVAGDAAQADAQGFQDRPPLVVGGQVAGERPVPGALVTDTAQHLATDGPRRARRRPRAARFL